MPRFTMITFVGAAIEADAQGYVYVAGRAGAGFPVTAGAFQTQFQGGDGGGSYGNQDGFVLKLSPSGQTIVWGSGDLQKEEWRLRKRLHLRDEALLVGVDRVDYTKGIPERFRAVDRLLRLDPGLRSEFSFIQVAAPVEPIFAPISA